MTQDEFNALKVGDKVKNMHGHVATVCATGAYGVQIRWNNDGPPFTLYGVGRAWIGMDVVNDTPTHEDVGTGYDSGAAAHELQGRKQEP